jgi:RNA polymerase sigma-70 factor (ECF subfamily)
MSQQHPAGDDLHDLVTKASAGDVPAIEALLAGYLPRLRAFVRLRTSALIRQRESCSDLVQSVCREVLQSAGQFEYRGDAAFRAWLFRTALHKILDRHAFLTEQKRDVRREAAAGDSLPFGELPSREPTASQVAVAAELQERMEAAFDLLPEDYREIIALSRVVGLSHAEIGEQLGRSEGACRMLLSRALAAYADAMDQVRRDQRAP